MQQNYGIKFGGDSPSKPSAYGFYEQFYVTACRVLLLQTLPMEIQQYFLGVG
jgi:hypothetical protein